MRRALPRRRRAAGGGRRCNPLRISEVDESQLHIYGDILKRDDAFIRF